MTKRRSTKKKNVAQEIVRSAKRTNVVDHVINMTRRETRIKKEKKTEAGAIDQNHEIEENAPDREKKIMIDVVMMIENVTDETTETVETKIKKKIDAKEAKVEA